MTKKDFTAIANILKNISDDVESVGLSHPPIIFIHIIINQLADYFETTNPRSISFGQYTWNILRTFGVPAGYAGEHCRS